MRRICALRPVRSGRGQRLKKESLAVTVGDRNIYEATNMSIVKFKEFMDELKLTLLQQTIGEVYFKG